MEYFHYEGTFCRSFLCVCFTIHIQFNKTRITHLNFETANCWEVFEVYVQHWTDFGSYDQCRRQSKPQVLGGSQWLWGEKLCVNLDWRTRFLFGRICTNNLMEWNATPEVLAMDVSNFLVSVCFLNYTNLLNCIFL